MIGNVRVRLDGTSPTTHRDRYVPNIPTSNRFSALRWFRGKHEDSMVEAGAKQKTRRFTKLKKIWVPKKETQKFEDQANISKTVWRKKNVNNNPLQDAGFEHSRGRKRKGMYRKSNYISQGPENTRVDKQTSTQQSKARISVFDRELVNSVGKLAYPANFSHQSTLNMKVPKFPPLKKQIFN
ncbi:hypothetical protein Taro_027966 [Colocasia esculenta]|uniref:Uncharacterized protein n=1 Tax=Colocasia esculenta TaxID=4460 RepID=A0A843VFY7_COLES|nr:hypothetical protein [Colocasia esculenta]